MSSNAVGKRSGLAEPASSPGQTSATATAATAAPADAASATPASSAAPCFLHAVLGGRSVFLVEYIEGCQADVGDFFIAKREFVTQSSDRRLRRIGRRRDGRGCATYERKS